MMAERVTLALRRPGDAIRYELHHGVLGLRGHHLLGDRYDLRFALRDLRPDHQTFWIKNSRQGVQLLLTATFVIVFGVAIMVAIRFPGAVKEHPGWFLSSLSLSLIALLLSVFARRVEVAVFSYRSGAEAFRVPAWGSKDADRRAFLAALASRIAETNHESATS
jgi:hypothetical protein